MLAHATEIQKERRAYLVPHDETVDCLSKIRLQAVKDEEAGFSYHRQAGPGRVRASVENDEITSGIEARPR
jgi:hypothetical protein